MLVVFRSSFSLSSQLTNRILIWRLSLTPTAVQVAFKNSDCMISTGALHCSLITVSAPTSPLLLNKSFWAGGGGDVKPQEYSSKQLVPGERGGGGEL